jgi:hypothetical protein
LQHFDGLLTQRQAEGRPEACSVQHLSASIASSFTHTSFTQNTKDAQLCPRSAEWLMEDQPHMPGEFANTSDKPAMCTDASLVSSTLRREHKLGADLANFGSQVPQIQQGKQRFMRLLVTGIYMFTTEQVGFFTA